MKKVIKAGATDQTIDIFVQDSSSTTGAGLTGLAYNTASLVCYYRKGATGSATALTLATQTVGGAHSDGGFVEISSANMPGMYRLDLSDTIVDTAGSVSLMLKGATNMAPLPIELQVGNVPADLMSILGTALTETAGLIAAGFKKFFNVATPTGTLNSLPDAVPGANNGLPTTNGTKLNQTVDLTAGQFQLKKNVARPNFAFPMRDSTGALKTGLTVTAEIRKDAGAAFAALAGAVTEIGATGWYTVDFAQAETNADTIAFSASAVGANQTCFTILTQA